MREEIRKKLCCPISKNRLNVSSQLFLVHGRCSLLFDGDNMKASVSIILSAVLLTVITSFAETDIASQVQINSKDNIITNREAKAVERAFRHLAKAPNRHEFIRNCSKITRTHFSDSNVSFNALSELFPKTYVMKSKKRLSEFDLTGWNYPNIATIAKTAIVIEIEWNQTKVFLPFFVFVNEDGEWLYDLLLSLFLVTDGIFNGLFDALKKN